MAFSSLPPCDKEYFSKPFQQKQFTLATLSIKPPLHK
jgi:hypothetical protein